MAHQVQVLEQSTAQLCWEACGRMLWAWKNGSLGGYPQRAGAYATMNRGLSESEMDVFYKRLGMRSLTSPNMNNVRHALGFSPLIFALMGKTQGHAVVATGVTAKGIRVANPCASMVVSFGDDGEDAASCSAGTITLPNASVRRELGHYVWYW